MLEASRSLLTSTSRRSAPSQIAAAIALGVLCGLIPTTSLLFYVALAAALLLPIHLPLMVGTTIVFVFLSEKLEPVLGAIGVRSLVHPELHSFWMKLDSLPLVPWFGLHNTVTNGGVLAGLALCLPIFVLSRLIVTRVLLLESAAVQQATLVGATEGRAIVDGLPLADQPVSLQKDARVKLQKDESLPNASVPTENQADRSIADLETLLAASQSSNANTDAEPPTSSGIMERAAHMVDMVDDVLATLEADLGTPKSRSAEPVSAEAGQAESPTKAAASPELTSSAELTSSLELTSSAEITTSPEALSTEGPVLHASKPDADCGPDHRVISMGVEPATESEDSSVGTSENIAGQSQAPTLTTRFESEGTVIEIVRNANDRTRDTANVQNSTGVVQSGGETAMMKVHQSKSKEDEVEPAEAHSQVDENTLTSAASAPPDDQHMIRRESPPEEILRNLLSHLRELREKV